MSKPVIYLAGPMTGLEGFNYALFRDVGRQLEQAGLDVRNPAEHDVETGFEPWLWRGTEPLSETGFDLEAALEWDLFQVSRADGVVILPMPSMDWKSEGLAKEMAQAKRYGVPMFQLGWSDFNWTESAEPRLSPIAINQVCAFAKMQKPNVLRVSAEKAKARDAVLSPVLNLEYTLEKGEYVLNAEDTKKFHAAKAITDPLFAGGAVENRWTGDKGEVRSVSSTGGEKGVKLARYDLIPVDALRQIAEHYGRGAEKYADNQWRKGYEWSKSFAALIRHANQFWGGEDYDEETGSNHMAAVAWHALTLLTFFEEHPDFDDRYVNEGTES
jgi:hypothetical protein